MNSETVRESHEVNESSFLVESGEDLAPSGEDEIQKHGELGLRGGCDWNHEILIIIKSAVSLLIKPVRLFN